MDVFATRSTFRPNPISLSAAKLERIVTDRGRVVQYLMCVDLLMETSSLEVSYGHEDHRGNSRELLELQIQRIPEADS
ncbi:MAG: TrmO family methyltransferase [Candidatus Competibacter sp.]|nr:TrmO family methyltransferase [Candidatus Competibacter sp.]MDS4041052.1 TrmO family methyltransferase [Candidatus Competibacter sp.]